MYALDWEVSNLETKSSYASSEIVITRKKSSSTISYIRDGGANQKLFTKSPWPVCFRCNIVMFISS